ncbi:MAG: hypothetical protein RMM31_08580 [Anaerolineae bacterium]|nr:hypothetical protein [Thermoflexales bacterium]MDW8396283.1 hypothetical protein [Anaerolineae bacterium]
MDERYADLPVEVALDELERAGVCIEGRDRVVHYLTAFPSLIQTLFRAVSAAREHLPEAELTLEVYQDPEIDDPHLVLYARQETYDPSFMERLERAEATYIDDLKYSKGWLNLATDFWRPSERRCL